MQIKIYSERQLYTDLHLLHLRQRKCEDPVEDCLGGSFHEGAKLRSCWCFEDVVPSSENQLFGVEKRGARQLLDKGEPKLICVAVWVVLFHDQDGAKDKSAGAFNVVTAS